MANGLSRLETRFLGKPAFAQKILDAHADGTFDAATANEEGLATFAPDAIDWDDELRLAIEERSAFSPDALTGMEANLRYPGPETMETKIFGRSAPGRTGSSSARTPWASAAHCSTAHPTAPSSTTTALDLQENRDDPDRLQPGSRTTSS
jgi:hypothetical protein